MKVLSSIVEQIEYQLVSGSLETEIADLTLDSREVKPGSLFAAIKGSKMDGHTFIPTALKQGAVAVLGEELPHDFPKEVAFIKVEDAAQALGFLASAFFGFPSRKLKMAAVTGTNGKTTVATLLYTLFSELGYTCGLLSTIENKIGSEVQPSKLTTPDAISVQRILAKMLEAGCTHAFMEASSHALVQGRMNGVELDGALFTNMSRDHLDYHGTFDNYIAAKKLLFDHLGKKAFALVNTDDKRGAVMLQNCKGKHCSYALRSMADFKGKLLTNSFEGLSMEINGQEAWFRLIGDFNAYNLLAVYGAALLLGEEEEQVLSVLSGLVPASGRFQQIAGPNGIKAVVDYAHTPDALENVLKTMSEAKSKSQKLTTLVGCGGDRDKGKRPQMAAIAAKYSDKVVLTADNPRTEDPAQIIEDMLEGLDVLGRGKAEIIEDRREAIQESVKKAQPHEIILIAGKGHETYQEINGQRYHFDDSEEVAKAFEEIT